MFSNNPFYYPTNYLNNDKFPEFGTKESNEYMVRTFKNLQITPEEIPLNIKIKTYPVGLNSCSSCTRFTTTSSRSGGGKLGPP